MPYKDPVKKRQHHADYLRRRLKEDTEYREKHRTYVRRRKAKIRIWLQKHKSSLRCAKAGCKMWHIACLEFHHNDPSRKEITLSKVVAYGWSIARIIVEIQKCTVYCSNHHKIWHWEND